MSDERNLNNLIGQTYDAAVGDEDWAVLLEQLKRALGGTAAVLRWNRRPAATAVIINIDPDVHRIYDTDYRGTDPIWSKVRQLPPGSAVDDCTLVPERALERTDVYNDLYAPNDLHFCLSWYTLDLAAQPVGMTMYRSRRRPFYAAEDLRLLQALAPHLNRAIAIEGRLATPEARRTAFGLSRQGPHLSRRECECLARIARGASNKTVARQLELSVYTINKHVEAAMRKLQAASRTQAVTTALLLGLLNL